MAFFAFNPPIYLGHKLHICLLFTRPLFHDVMLVNHFRGEAKLVFLFWNHSISILWNFFLHPFLQNITFKKKIYHLFFRNNFSSILLMFWLNPLPLKDSNGHGNWPLSFSARPNYGFTRSSPLLWLSLWPWFGPWSLLSWLSFMYGFCHPPFDFLISFWPSSKR